MIQKSFIQASLKQSTEEAIWLPSTCETSVIIYHKVYNRYLGDRANIVIQRKATPEILVLQTEFESRML